jgi:hypothetical protein
VHAKAADAAQIQIFSFRAVKCRTTTTNHGAEEDERKKKWRKLR